MARFARSANKKKADVSETGAEEVQTGTEVAKIDLMIPTSRVGKMKLPRRKLTSANDLRRYLANLLLRLEADYVEGQKATRLCYIAANIIKCVETADLEARLQTLEESISGNQGAGVPAEEPTYRFGSGQRRAGAVK